MPCSRGCWVVTAGQVKPSLGGMKHIEGSTLMMSDNPTHQEILDAVKRSGYLMEQDIASVLENDGYTVATNSAFSDTDNEISREVDILARKKVYESESNKIKVFVELICECKNNQNPFVFISRKKNSADFKRDPQEYYFPNQAYYTGSLGFCVERPYLGVH